MINVLYYGMGYNRGGIERYLFRIAQNIDKNNFKISFINEQGENLCYRDELMRLGAEIYDVTPRRKGIIVNKREVEEIFKKNRIDILHYNVNTLSYIEPVLAALKYGCKVILHSRNASNEEKIWTRLLHQIHFKRLEKKELTRIAVSQKAGIWLFGKNANFRIFHNGLDVKKNAFSCQKRDQARKELGFEDKIVLGNIGVFMPVKNQRFVIDILYKLLQVSDKYSLLLIGDGPTRKELAEYVKQLGIESNVIFTGIRNDVEKLLNSMDVFIFPSKYEGFPNVVLEAQTNGLQCIISEKITKEVAITDLVQFESIDESVDCWVKRILRIKNNIKERKKYEGILLEKGYSKEEEIRKIEELYYEVIGG